MLNEEELGQFLRGIEAFADVSDTAIAKLVDAFEERVCHPGEVVICQDALGKELCIVLEGEMLVTIAEKGEDETGQAVQTSRVGPTLKRGDIFGEIGVISGMESSATVCASMEGCSILVMGGRKLHEQVLRNSPALASGLLRSMKRYL
ncbi:MAG: cyclic nucleotide-binding domain-containing protein [Verrucomicrobiales bacterium]|nr:cyclic nucleotide-binding domain-containing protein [Verrucomicrobiales bacterium]